MNVEIKLDREKYHALKMSMEQKGTTVEAELAQAAEVLYQKQVPSSVKAFIESKSKGKGYRPKRKPQGTSASAVGIESK